MQFLRTLLDGKALADYEVQGGSVLSLGGIIIVLRL